MTVGMFVWVSLWMSVCMLMVSKAFDMSSAMVIVLLGLGVFLLLEFLELNALVIVLFM